MRTVQCRDVRVTVVTHRIDYHSGSNRTSLTLPTGGADDQSSPKWLKGELNRSVTTMWLKVGGARGGSRVNAGGKVTKMWLNF